MRNKIFGAVCVVWCIIGIFSAPLFIHNIQTEQVFAQTPTPNQGPANTGGASQTGAQLPRLGNPLRVDSVTGVIDLIIGLALRAAFIIAVLAIMYSGFLFVKAQGSDDEITHAKTVFWNTIIGVALIFGASGLVKIIQVTIEAVKAP